MLFHTRYVKKQGYITANTVQHTSSTYKFRLNKVQLVKNSAPTECTLRVFSGPRELQTAVRLPFVWHIWRYCRCFRRRDSERKKTIVGCSERQAFRGLGGNTCTRCSCRASTPSTASSSSRSRPLVTVT